MTDKIIQLTSKGRLLVVTDLHGNIEDYEKYIQLWQEDNPDCHIVFVGDLIHSIDDNDKSIEILEDVMEKYEKYPNFHPLLGNHEWSQIFNIPVYKGHKNQTNDFMNLIKEKKGSYEPHISNYVEFFKSMPLFLQTENGLFISHTGPSKTINNINDFKNSFKNNYNNTVLHDFLWNRHEIDYTKKDVDKFLKIINSKCMIVGHTVVDGYFTYGNQMILSSSFATNNKAYLDIDLSVPIKNMHQLTKKIKYLE